MKNTFERRKEPGVAIVTVRPSYIKAICALADLPSRPLLVQPGPSWPTHRPPVVLDTIGLPIADLVALLAAPPQAQQATLPKPGSACLRPCTDYEPLIALADPNDLRVLRLLRMCPAVQLICPEDAAKLKRWLPHFGNGLPMPGGNRVWLVEKPAEPPLDPLLLAALAALATSPSVNAAAEKCGVSPSTMARMLRNIKQALGLPSGGISRFRPEELAAAILGRLSARSPSAKYCLEQPI